MEEVKANILEGKYEEILAAVQSPVIALTELIKNSADSCKDIETPITVSIDTQNRSIEITDKGKGISLEEIKNLGAAGYSTKMVGENTKSPIDNPLSGSKGLGLLTAFFIAEILEIETYSEENKKAYFIFWKRGEQKYTYSEIAIQETGTRILLKNVETEKLKMILLQEERQKLFMTSVRFYTDEKRLPSIELFIDGDKKDFYPPQALEDFYNQNRADNKGFVAKANFQYKDNKIILSYEDNVSGFYTFSDQIIDLQDQSSVNTFITNIKAPDKGPILIRRIAESELFKADFCEINVPEFYGVLYTWRNKKGGQLEYWPAGVRIYINDYSLYRYLDKDNDWLNLSEISQNSKATNYKLKNTYGFLNFPYYIENNEKLKISKERNDFVDSLEQRKFIKIMRDIIAATVSKIDMLVKNPPTSYLGLKQESIIVRIGEKIPLFQYVFCSNLEPEDIILTYDEKLLTIDDEWNISAKSSGSYRVKMTHNETECELELCFKEKIPHFSLTHNSIEFDRGNTIKLRDFISINSCRDIDPEKIQILAENQVTMISNELFSKDNVAGRHVVLYRYGEFQRTLIVNVKEIETQIESDGKIQRIDVLFPRLELLRSKSFKIPELIDAISKYYVVSPTLCMAAVRILVESSCRAFFQYLKNEECNYSFDALVNKCIGLQGCIETNPDYKMYIEGHEQKFKDEFKRVSENYNVSLSRDVRNNIKKHLDEINLNMFVHNPLTIATDTTVYKSMQIFSPLLNYIFEILLIE